MEEPYTLTLTEASQLIHSHQLSPLQLMTSLLQRIDILEPKLRAWSSLDINNVLSIAEQYSEEAKKGNLRGPLHGIPIGIKDIYYTKGMKTTMGSTIFADFVPSYDATTITRLKTAGAIILGKTETTEFAAFDPAPTRNPWNLEHTPGGSSSGSAAAVATGMCPAALGSQTGGSTIRPAAYCGIIGVKPTYGRISRYGVFPVSWSLDHVGVFTRTVADAALLLETLAGHDPKDASSSSRPVPHYCRALERPSPPSLGLVTEFFYGNAQEEVRTNLEAITHLFRTKNADILPVSLPESFDAVHAAHHILMITEAATVHDTTFQTRMFDYKPNIRGMIASGLLVNAVTYLNAQRVRSLFIKAVASLLEDVDCLIMPATPTPAPKGLDSTGDPAFNSPWSFCGYPSLTIPSGVTEDGLPLGIQLVGRPFDEERLLKVGCWCDKTIGFGQRPHTPA